MSETVPGHAERTVPEFHPVADRKLNSLLADGWQINGYAIMKGEDRRGFVDFGGFVGWWLPEHYASHTSDATPIAAHGAGADDTHAFKNFHRLLCERFGYTHDEVDWRRDQVSLIEWIARRAPGAGAVTEALEKARAWISDNLRERDIRGCTALAAVTNALRPEAAGQGEAEELPARIAWLASPTPRPAPVAPDIVPGFTPAAWLVTAQQGYDTWAAKPHNAKWVRKIDGTPIPNDLVVCIGTAFAEALAALSSELAKAKRERDTYLDNWKDARIYWNIETGHAESAEARAEAAEAEAARLKDENKELVAGLEPFAEFGEYLPAQDGWAGTDQIELRFEDARLDEIALARFWEARSLTAAKGG